MATRRGFSLIELLVVMFIIALLLGILLPTLPRIRDAANRTACSANLRSLGQAMQMYTDEHDDRFPMARYMPPPWLSGDDDPPLTDILLPYLSYEGEAFRCPGDRVVFQMEYVDDEGRTRECGSSYTFIIALSGIRYEDSFYARALNWTRSQTPVLHDYDNGGYETQDGEIIQVDVFHRQRNFLYVDGHVDRWRGE